MTKKQHDVKWSKAAVSTTSDRNAAPGVLRVRNRQRVPILETAALTIAGSDSSGGAGIQADLASFFRSGVYGASAITALTAQNTLGVTEVQTSSPEFVHAQLRAVFEDLPIRAAKTGMLANAGITGVVAEFMETVDTALVVDPVMIATSGARLLDEDAIEILRQRLLPRATLVTPNLPEARALAGLPDEDDPRRLGEAMLRAGCRAVLVKGGHGSGETVADWLSMAEGQQVFRHPRVPAQIHGTGCYLSAGITAGLAKGMELAEAVAAASDALQEAIAGARKPVKGELLLLASSSATPGT